MSRTVEAPQSVDLSRSAQCRGFEGAWPCGQFPAITGFAGQIENKWNQRDLTISSELSIPDLEGDCLHRLRNGLLDRDDYHLEEHIVRHAQRPQMRASQQRISLAFDSTRTVSEF
jgi:hypothetical protein